MVSHCNVKLHFPVDSAGKCVFMSLCAIHSFFVSVFKHFAHLKLYLSFLLLVYSNSLYILDTDWITSPRL